MDRPRDRLHPARAVACQRRQLELIEIELPPKVSVPYPASAFAFQHEQIVVMQGSLLFTEGTVAHRLEAGDCLQLGTPEDCTFSNPGARPCRYLVALARRSS